MFLNIKVDLSQLKDEKDYKRVQEIANTVQRCIYRTRGALNKFLMDDKGSVMLVAWGLPPLSSRNDPIDGVSSCITILHEFNKYIRTSMFNGANNWYLFYRGLWYCRK